MNRIKYFLTEKKEGGLVKNTVMLYVLQFSTYFFSLATVPYQTRVLGVTVFGALGFATEFMAYFQLLMDFGFMLSATGDISLNRSDKEYINRRLTSVTVIKLFLCAVSFIIMGSLILTVKKFRADPALYLLYLAAYSVNAFVPDYLYRGIEKMTAITVRTVCVRAFFTLLIFVFLRSESQYLLVPLFLLAGNIAAVVSAYIHIYRVLGCRFVRVSAKDVLSDLRRSFTFFLSRIASTVYSSTNTVILGMIDNTGIMTGLYTSANKVVTTARSAASPLSDSLYPYMVKNRDFKPAKLLLLFTMPVIISGCVIVWIFAPQLCVFAFGSEYEASGDVLRAFIPAIAAILPSYVFGFPVLSSLGKSNYANLSVGIGAAVHLAGIAILCFTGGFSAVGFAALSSVSECSILLCRILMTFFTVKKQKSKKES